MKIYHTQTQEDFEDFVEKNGVPCQLEWEFHKEDTGILFEDDGFSIMDIGDAERWYPEHEIVKYEREKSCQTTFIEHLIEDYEAKKNDTVNSPSHYTNGERETIEIIRDILGHEGYQYFCVGNIVKYISRYKNKNGLEDIKKAGKYIEFLEDELASL